MLAIIGILGGLISLVSNIPYMLNTAKGKTSPHRVSWGIFFLLNLVIIDNQLSAGARNSMWLIAAFTISTFIIFILSFKHGEGGKTKGDVFALISALIGIVIWQLMHAPIAYVICDTIVTWIAGYPTLRKAYAHPQSETSSKWFFGSLAGLLAAVSVGSFRWVVLLLPLANCVYQGAVFTLIIAGVKKSRTIYS